MYRRNGHTILGHVCPRIVFKCNTFKMGKFATECAWEHRFKSNLVGCWWIVLARHGHAICYHSSVLNSTKYKTRTQLPGYSHCIKTMTMFVVMILLPINLPICVSATMCSGAGWVWLCDIMTQFYHKYRYVCSFLHTYTHTHTHTRIHIHQHTPAWTKKQASKSFSGKFTWSIWLYEFIYPLFKYHPNGFIQFRWQMLRSTIMGWGVRDGPDDVVQAKSISFLEQTTNRFLCVGSLGAFTSFYSLRCFLKTFPTAKTTPSPLCSHCPCFPHAHVMLNHSPCFKTCLIIFNVVVFVYLAFCFGFFPVRVPFDWFGWVFHL